MHQAHSGYSTRNVGPASSATPPSASTEEPKRFTPRRAVYALLASVLALLVAGFDDCSACKTQAGCEDCKLGEAPTPGRIVATLCASSCALCAVHRLFEARRAAGDVEEMTTLSQDEGN